MNNIIDIQEFKNKNKKTKSNKELEFICDEILALWTANFHADMIDEMICDRLNIKFHKYTTDLNGLNELEQSFGVNFITFGPNTTDNNPVGYLTGVKMPNNDGLIATPEMLTENLSRIFALVFYNELLMQEYI